MRFLFPSDYFNSKKVDEAYLEQFDCLQNIGFETSIICLESLGSKSVKIFPILESGAKLIYRGWMITPDEYSLFINTVRNAGCEALISHSEYLATHYLPNWYPLICDLTPETHFFSVDDNLESALSGLEQVFY